LWSIAAWTNFKNENPLIDPAKPDAHVFADTVHQISLAGFVVAGCNTFFAFVFFVDCIDDGADDDDVGTVWAIPARPSLRCHGDGRKMR
jgi:hypothetical protein